jgi:ElaB/YqjD/DUF883 family membrane-anchored ribosome-binding protein
MSTSVAKDVRHHVEDGLEEVTRALQRSAAQLSGDAQAAVAKAAAEVARAADTLSQHATKTAKTATAKTVQGVQEHPVVALAAAITAAAALVGVLAATRNNKDKVA